MGCRRGCVIPAGEHARQARDEGRSCSTRARRSAAPSTLACGGYPGSASVLTHHGLAQKSTGAAQAVARRVHPDSCAQGYDSKAVQGPSGAARASAALPRTLRTHHRGCGGTDRLLRWATHAEWLVPLRVVGIRSGTSIELGRVRSAVHRGRVPTWRICWAHKSGHHCEAGVVGCMWSMTAV